MKFFDSAGADDPEINVISLIDVILVLLIFFMATATFEQQSRIKLNLPEASDKVSEKDQGQSLVIQVGEDGRYFVGNSEVLNQGIDTLKAAIEQSAKADRKQRVIIRADAKTPHQSVVMAMDAVAQLGFVNLSIATVRAKANP
jgi:biopolymer transport protein ExbD